MPKRQVTLGLELQGGSYLLLEVELQPVYRERLEAWSATSARRSGRPGSAIGGLGVQGDTVTLT